MKEYFCTNDLYINLELDFPYTEMLKEAVLLKDKFVSHRASNSKGWKSLALYGLAENKTGTWKDYGYKSGKDSQKDMHWTPASNIAKNTKEYLLTNFPCNIFGRVRFMLLEPGGYIGTHSDGNTPMLENTTFILNNPDGCNWFWTDNMLEQPIDVGNAYMFNISFNHRLENNSNEDRYHLIVSRHDTTKKFKNYLSKLTQKNNIKGNFIFYNDLP